MRIRSVQFLKLGQSSASPSLCPTAVSGTFAQAARYLFSRVRFAGSARNRKTASLKRSARSYIKT